MDKEIIFEGKIKVDDQLHKVSIQSGLDEAGTARFYATVDKQPPVELFHNPDTHLWEQLKVGETELAQVCGEVIEAYYA
jgi:hypothetical protein